MLFCHVTSRVEGEPYPGLLREKGGSGFPTLAFLDQSGELLTKYSGARDVSGFTATGERVKEYMQMEELAKKGKKGADLDLFLAGIKLGKFTLDQAKQKAKEFQDLNKKQAKSIDDGLLNLEVSQGYGATYRDAQAAAKLGEQWFELAKQKKYPTDVVAGKQFWTLIQHYGKSSGDAKAERMAKGALKKLKKRK